MQRRTSTRARAGALVGMVLVVLTSIGPLPSGVRAAPSGKPDAPGSTAAEEGLVAPVDYEVRPDGGASGATDLDLSVLGRPETSPARPPTERTELSVPRELDELVLACLQKDPRHRPQDAGELYQMACQVRIRDEWNSSEAKHWWRAHLPQLSGPLKISESRRDTAEPVTM